MIYFAEDLLPNHRPADKCCSNCRHCSAGYEGEGDCGVLEKFKEERENEEKDIYVCTTISIYEVCDLWEKEE